MVENLFKMDDLGVPPFQEPPHIFISYSKNHRAGLFIAIEACSGVAKGESSGCHAIRRDDVFRRDEVTTWPAIFPLQWLDDE